MSVKKKSTSRRLGLTVGAAALAVGLATLTAAPAQAAYQLKDSLDTPGTWFTTVVGTGTAAVTPSGAAGTAPGAGRVGRITSSGSGFSSVGRYVTIAPSSSCTASFWLLGSETPASVNVEVIRPSTWTYLSLKKVNMGAYSEFSPVSFTLDPAWGTVVFRVSIGGGGAGVTRSATVDNLQIDCV